MNYLKEITLDLAHHQGGNVIRIHEGDHNASSLSIDVYNKGVAYLLTGMSVKYDAVIAGYLAESDASGSISGNVITIPITPNMTAMPGKLLIDVKILDGTGDGQTILYTQTISAIVEKKIIDGAVIIDISGTTIGAKLEDHENRLDDLEDRFPVGTSDIDDGAVTEAKIGSGAVTSGKLGAGAVETAKIADSAVTSAKLGAGAVETAKIADNAVTTAKINSGAVTKQKLADDVKEVFMTLPSNELSSDDTSGVNIGQIFKYNGEYYIKSSAATPVGAQVKIQNARNLVTSMSSSSTDSEYPSAKCTFEAINALSTIVGSANDLLEEALNYQEEEE